MAESSNTKADKMNEPMPVSQETPLDVALNALAAGLHRDPFALLGPHVDGQGRVVIRTIQPSARGVQVRLAATGELVPMARRNGVVYEAVLGAKDAQRPAAGEELPDYRLVIRFPGDHVVEIDDT